jgi:hypothetical protein
MQAQWEPANDSESRLLAALHGGDTVGFLAVLAGCELALPISPEAAAGAAPVAWPTVEADGRTYMVAYTSPQSIVYSTGGAVPHCRHTTFRGWRRPGPTPAGTCC